jgi:YgiT-type zinc finger domain-containing protein
MGIRFFRENKMKCAICRNGMTESGYTTVLLEKDYTTLVFKNVPAQICSNCGEEYVSSEINRAILSRAREESGRGITLEMLRFAA